MTPMIRPRICKSKETESKRGSPHPPQSLCQEAMRNGADRPSSISALFEDFLDPFTLNADAARNDSGMTQNRRGAR
jgi:hypothetical protein